MRNLGTWDVAVIGSGPAGGAAAHALARGGARVIVLEKAVLPRYKTCGGGLVARAQALAPSDVVEKSIQRQFHRVELRFLDSQLSFAAERDTPVMGVIMRDRFDYALLTAALDANADHLAPCTVKGLSEDTSGLTLSTDQGRIRSRLVIGADGASGFTARTAGWTGHLPTIPALEWEAEVSHEVYARFEAAPRFDFGTIARGYAWVFPKDGHLSVGIGCAGPPDTNLKLALTRYLERIGCGPILAVRKHGYVIPSRPRRGGFYRGRVILAGDAAGLTDPITFEGISHALLSGQIAARAILAGDLDPTRTGRAYQAGLSREILPELRLARGLARLLYGPVWLRNRLFDYAGDRMVEAMTEVIAGRRSYRELLCSPRRYMRLLFASNRN